MGNPIRCTAPRTAWLARSALAALGSVGLAGPALAQDKALDAAMQADEVNQRYCADLYSGKVDVAAGATVAVAEVWQQVSAVYEETKAPYLLYWRGALAQCLGRDEAAVADLEAFVAASGQSTMFADIVRQANGRLRRLGGKAQVGSGAAARWLRRQAALEIDLRYGIGGGASTLHCTDDDEPESGPRVENSGCVGGRAFDPQSAPLFAPALLEASISAWPAVPFGLGGRAVLAVPAPNGLPDARSPGVTGDFELGPALRFGNSVASGKRAGSLRVEPRLAISLASLSPWAGSSKYVAEMQAFLDAGTLRLFQLGPALRLLVAGELGPSLALAVEGRFAWFPALPGSVASTQRGPATVPVRIDDGGTTEDASDDTYRDEAVRVLPELLNSSRMAAGLRVQLLRAHEERPLASGPFLDFGWTRAALVYPDDPADVWCAAEPCGLADGDLRKVFSTRRDDWVARVGIELRLGRGSAKGAE
jgi:hypothetical protein